jgi:preprotein translocase subunit SecE
MAMNRETKRMLQRQGAVGTDGATARTARRETVSTAKSPGERTSPAQFVREVRGELRKVAWPTRAEVVNYTIVVLITVLVMMAFIAALDWLFGTAVLELFDK